MYQNRHSHRRLRAKKKSQAIDLTNAAVKRKSALAAWKSLAGRAGDLALLHGRDAELLDPPVYRVRRTRRNSVPTKGTEF
ncbi:hypothetical protein HMPREF0578_1506 [Mobiluncus mulieris 28-1]|uniref:Uncharacterized protein n=2 Tax=Mobiluncus mulieris TaxID=2052 RepID=E0QNT0_9ACTO|nr:hypothetical protein [Mobiluncus mulieris]EEJ52878.1 hypothetical protein HMPREF0577_2191 [Mobiluncus mulieris ATCC 35243]EEZ92176.1 hypothetical protein HMPREF0578_1506 [Mobiluncus mulieris 28-1]EFM46826.1 hypothetical protein HMPREF0580_0544 [Mobiluncus mulieris ATCC 35239]EFN92504.1 hypothetical protein HMPREF9278_0079 [Mobiluncus mulieris FB024-16]MBB5847039.1 hypothetical protein [Mobiluncus mulieris]